MKIEEQAMSLSPFAFTACELLDVMMSVASEVKSMLDDAKSKPENERIIGEVLYSSLLSCVTMALGSLFTSHKIRTLEVFRVAIGQSKVSYYPLPNDTIAFGSFNKNTQKRWKKPVAQTRLEDRARDLKIDKLMNELKRLRIVLKLHELMSNRRGPYVSMQLLSRWKNVIGLNIGIGVFLRKYHHIFEIFTHPVKKNLCCKITKKMVDLIKEEDKVIKESEIVAVQRLKKLLMVSTNGILHIHALRLIRRELGLPEDFRESILLKYSSDFKLVDLENVALVSRDESLAVADVEKWREKEYREKWLSEFETRYAFQIHFPTGFKIEKGFREKLKNWQRLPYLKPYERKEVVRVRTCGGVERFEKCVVSILHEFLSLTVEKMVEIERLSHFRKDFSMEINVLELLLKHPGIFYISTKGSTQTVLLREAYNKGSLVAQEGGGGLAALRLDFDEEMIVSFFDFIKTVISRRSQQQSSSDWSSLTTSFPFSKKAKEDICRSFLAHPRCLEMEVLPHHNLLFISAALLFRLHAVYELTRNCRAIPINDLNGIPNEGNLMGFARNVGLDIKDFLSVPAKGILQVHIIHNIKV
ncbi:hypothetical protein HHK36_001948 [Tetracentron sinense]|uniref:PORR domain-containing protein n=1 Tax=Tetracentron sinense TaxID=13715 RepID=A0A834ZUZ0_TETSI|nr:hypothetical protein HHK36_001948 [Tetracentron sinense]